MASFYAIVIEEQGDEVIYQRKKITLDDLSAGDVLIKVHYSSVNYKDMLAVQKRGGVIRNYPMIPGIDLSGVVESSNSDEIQVGEKVLVTGFEMGMSHTGGFAEYARVPAGWVIPLPEELSLKDAMVLGTAGLTAALSIDALQQAGMTPEKAPRILVTGATGGVGSLALQILAKSGYPNLHALVRKDYQADIAKAMGATEIVFPQDLGENTRPLNKQNYDYVLDTVGGDVAATLISQLSYDGAMSMCGNAGGIKLNTTVLPFILRNIRLLGIDSVNISEKKRLEMWQKLATAWNVSHTELSREINLEELPETINALKSGQHLGRTIIKL